jgi:hypothetical protein
LYGSCDRRNALAAVAAGLYKTLAGIGLFAKHSLPIDSAGAPGPRSRRGSHAMNRQVVNQCVCAVCLSAGIMGSLVATSLHAQQPAPQPVQASNTTNRQGRQVSLFDQLRVGLKAVTKEDFAFINLVVLRVNEGVLPRELVDSTFLWARNRYRSHSGRHRLRPMVYFKPALTARAKKLGVLL